MVDLSALAAFEEQYAHSNYESDVVFMRQRDVPEGGSIYLRILPNLPDMSGLPFVAVVQHWFKLGAKKSVIVSPESFKERDVVTPALEQLKAQYPQLVDYLKNNQNYNKETIFQVPCYIERW
jgi:hypothetical protein